MSVRAHRQWNLGDCLDGNREPQRQAQTSRLLECPQTIPERGQSKDDDTKYSDQAGPGEGIEELTVTMDQRGRV